MRRPIEATTSSIERVTSGPSMRSAPAAVDGRGGVRQVAVVVGHQGRERAGAVEHGALDEQLRLDLQRVAHGAHDGRPLHVVVARGGEPGLDAEQGPEGPPGWRDEQDVVGAQPLVVKAHEGGPGLRVVEHPPGLGLNACPGVEVPRLGRREQRLVGHRVPQEPASSTRRWR